MKELMNSVAARRSDIELTALVGDMQEGLNAAARALESGDFDIIVSRGGTAELLSRSVSLMTLDITVTLGDILQAVKLAENYKEKFAVVGFSGITGPAAVLCRLLNYGIEVCPVHEGAEVRPLLNRLKIEGCTMVVCDNITSIVAREAGLSAVLVTSGEASIQAAFDQAVKLCRSNSVLRTQNRLYVQALRAVGKSVILDENGGVVFSTLEDTSAALSEFIASASETALRDGECLAEKNIEGMTVRLRAERFAANQENYAVVTVTKEPPLTALREGCVTVLNRNDTLREQFNHYYGTNAGNLRSMVQNYSVYPLPVVIAGEKGTGKNSAANYIYQHGLFSQNQYYVIDCARMTERGWQSLVRNSASPLFTAKTTVYMNDVGALTPQQQPDLTAFATDGAHLYYPPGWVLELYRKNRRYLPRAWLHSLLQGSNRPICKRCFQQGSVNRETREAEHIHSHPDIHITEKRRNCLSNNGRNSRACDTESKVSDENKVKQTIKNG